MPTARVRRRESREWPGRHANGGPQRCAQISSPGFCRSYADPPGPVPFAAPPGRLRSEAVHPCGRRPPRRPPPTGFPGRPLAASESRERAKEGSSPDATASAVQLRAPTSVKRCSSWIGIGAYSSTREWSRHRRGVRARRTTAPPCGCAGSRCCACADRGARGARMPRGRTRSGVVPPPRLRCAPVGSGRGRRSRPVRRVDGMYRPDPHHTRLPIPPGGWE